MEVLGRIFENTQDDNMNYKIAWSGLADAGYWNMIAKHCVPSWVELPGDKFLVHDSDIINLNFVEIIDWHKIYNKKSKFLTMTNKSKPLNFWKKMQSQIWALKNLTSYDFLILLDTDVEILDFNKEKFNKELEQLKASGFVWATGCSQTGGLDAGHIIINMSHPQLNELITDYENIWESGEILKLKKWYDGDAVESLFEKYPSHRIKNRDYGSGLHIYEIGTVHWGSKLPKQLRAEWKGDGKSLVKKRLSEITIKKYKNDITPAT
jgi:hypothetical protein